MGFDPGTQPRDMSTLPEGRGGTEEEASPARMRDRMPKPPAARAEKVSLNDEELGKFVRFHLGLQNRPRVKIWWYKIKGEAVLMSTAQMDDVLPLAIGKEAGAIRSDSQYNAKTRSEGDSTPESHT